jgi:GNAT superfamily N-acetyltransferase
MTASNQPVWRQFFDFVEKPLRARTEAMVGTEEFAQTLLTGMGAFNVLNEKSRDALAKVMHLYNLSAHSDLTKLSRQVGGLTNKVETILSKLEAIEEALDLHQDIPRLAPPIEPAPKSGGRKKKLQVRQIQSSDAAPLFACFLRIPDEERAFIKEDELNEELAEAWANDLRDLHIVAARGAGEIVGFVNVVPGAGLSRHVGELRMVVSPSERGKGIGRMLARQALIESVEKLALRKIIVEV